MAGCAFGLASVAATAAAGLGALIAAAPGLQLAMKAAGSAYLLWLAWRIGRSGAPRRADAAEAPAGFFSGVLLLWLTPKGWSTSLAAAASFAALGAGPFGFALLLAATLGLAASVSLCLWCAAGLVLARALRTERQWRIVNAGLGLVLAISVVPMWVG
jgi:threonine/homoserine/homoserine lactone efflux protein